MTDIGYCNTCVNPECKAERIKLNPQRDCPKGLAWIGANISPDYQCNACGDIYWTVDRKCLECGSTDYTPVVLDEEVFVSIGRGDELPILDLIY